MGKEKNIKNYTATELKAMHGRSRTDLAKFDAITDDELEKIIAEDENESDLNPDWTQAKLVVPKAKRSVHLRLEQDIVDYFKDGGKGHIVRMQAVLRAYVNAHRPHAR